MLLEPLIREKGKTIKVLPETHEALNEVGLRGETFDDIIMRLIEFYKKGSRK